MGKLRWVCQHHWIVDSEEKPKQDCIRGRVMREICQWRELRVVDEDQETEAAIQGLEDERKDKEKDELVTKRDLRKAEEKVKAAELLCQEAGVDPGLVQFNIFMLNCQVRTLVKIIQEMGISEDKLQLRFQETIAAELEDVAKRFGPVVAEAKANAIKAKGGPLLVDSNGRTLLQ